MRSSNLRNRKISNSESQEEPQHKEWENRTEKFAKSSFKKKELIEHE